MKTFEEVRAQIEALPPWEYVKLAKWFAERESDYWDKEIERDAVSGRLDFLVEKTKTA